jgi:hypothetical protein
MQKYIARKQVSDLGSSSLEVYLYFLDPLVHHVTKAYLRTISTTVAYKQIFKCLIPCSFHFNPTTCFKLYTSSSVSCKLHESLPNYMHQFFKFISAIVRGTRQLRSLRTYATSRKFASMNPDKVTELLYFYVTLPATLWPCV